MKHCAALSTIRLIFLTAFKIAAISGSGRSPINKSFQPQLVPLRDVRSSEESVVVISKSRRQSLKEDIDVSHITLNAFELCLCGALATVFGDLVMHPLDTIKVMQQTGGGLSMIGTAKSIISSSGFFGLYQGVVPYCTADGLSGAIKFATFELSKIFVEARTAVKYHPVAQFVCAAGAMLACSIILVPGEVLKTRLQAGMVSSLFGGIAQILKEDGVGGLFAGYFATLVRDIPYTMLELGIYENIKAAMRAVRGKKELDQRDELLAAAITGGCASFFTTPLDVIKTKLMIQSSSGGKYSGVLDALVSTFREGGLSGLYVGSVARVSWLLPFTTIYLGVYEFAKKSLLRRKIELYIKRQSPKNAVGLSIGTTK